jgi:hypothetical protein
MCAVDARHFVFAISSCPSRRDGWPQVSRSVGGDMFAFVMIVLMFGAVIVMVKKADKDANIIGYRDASKTARASELN